MAINLQIHGKALPFKGGEHGFTLAELLVGIALFSTLAAIALPSWVSLVQDYQLDSAARQLATELHAARTRAMAQYTRVRIVFDANSTYSIQKEQTPGAGDYALLMGPRSLPEGITVTSTASPVFQSRGDASGATITLTNSESDQKVIDVSLAGTIDIQ